MKLRMFTAVISLILLLMVSTGCGRKGPPRLPDKPSALIKLEQEVQVAGQFMRFLDRIAKI